MSKTYLKIWPSYWSLNFYDWKSPQFCESFIILMMYCTICWQVKGDNEMKWPIFPRNMWCFSDAWWQPDFTEGGSGRHNEWGLAALTGKPQIKSQWQIATLWPTTSIFLPKSFRQTSNQILDHITKSLIISVQIANQILNHSIIILRSFNTHMYKRLAGLQALCDKSG